MLHDKSNLSQQRIKKIGIEVFWIPTVYKAGGLGG